MSEKIEIKFNGEQLAVEAGRTILEVAREQGVFIPTLCYSELVDAFTSCFVCVVELEGRPNLVPSCSTKVVAGMSIVTESERVARARRTAIELLLSDHVGDCLGPCVNACPAGIDIPGFVAHVAKGELEEAYELIKHNMPLPGSLGRICTRPCETACRRQLVDEPITVCQLKRYVADAVGGVPLPQKAPSTGKRVAVVGAGPSGLSAAYYLQIRGHACTVFEAQEAPGGMLRYGIPSYRLPRQVIDEEVKAIEELGATFKYGVRLGRDITMDALRNDFDAVYLALGAQKASAMRVDGENLPGVLSGIGFLGECSRNESMSVGSRVMVVGGGNTAIDAARAALRLGGSEVSILYRRTRAEMPAWEDEIVAAEEEGVKLELLAAPIKIEPRDDGALAVTCIRMTLGEPDESGRRRPVPEAGSEHVRVVDNVVAAIGQNVTAECATGVPLTRWGAVEADPVTMQTAIPQVFSGGDCVSGADIAVTAVGAGRRAAIAIDQFVRGSAVIGEPVSYNHQIGALADVPRSSYARFQKAERAKMPHLPAGSRARSFREVEIGFTKEAAEAEAKRCLSCGCRGAADCKVREYAGLFGADPSRFAGASREYSRDDSHPDVVHESSKCIQCGICVQIGEKVAGTSSMGFVNRGFASMVQPALGRPMASVPSKGLDLMVQHCPTGALTHKTARVDVPSADLVRQRAR